MPFILQIGDLVEGLCGSEALATKQANDALDLVRRSEFPTPFLFTKGNHDITGPGAVDAYRQLLLPFISQAAGSNITEAAFARRQGGTLVAFYDAYDKNSLDWFDKTLAESKPERRRESA